MGKLMLMPATMIANAGGEAAAQRVVARVEAWAHRAERLKDAPAAVVEVDAEGEVPEDVEQGDRPSVEAVGQVLVRLAADEIAS